MGVQKNQTFMSGNSKAVRLQRELGLGAGTPVKIERIGDTLTIRPVADPAAQKRRL